MKKRLAALLFCLALLFQAMIPSAYALRSIYFTAAGNEVLPLEDGKMPLWYNGYLYLPSTIFTGRVNRSLDVAYLPNTAAAGNLSGLNWGRVTPRIPRAGTTIPEPSSGAARSTCPPLWWRPFSIWSTLSPP